MTHIVGAASEFQLDITRERMADARAALKRRGKRVAGRIPFGYQAEPNTKALRPDPEQAIVVRDFFKLAAEGSRPSELATLANLRGWENHAGETGRWTSRGITKLLSNAIYTGRIHNGTETFPGEHDSIVNQETFVIGGVHGRPLTKSSTALSQDVLRKLVAGEAYVAVAIAE